MNNIYLNIVANAQFQQAYAEVAKLKEAMTTLQKTSVGSPLTASAVSSIKASQAAFDSAILSTRAFNLEQVALTSNVEKFGKQLSTGKLSLNQYYNLWRSNLRGTSAELDALATQQARLNRSIAIADPLRPGYARLITDINAVVTAEEKAVFYQRALNTAIQQGSIRLIDFGKNMQWAGRQMTVGLTMPMAMFAAGTASMFYKFDEQMTSMLKVYGAHAVVQSQEVLDQIRKDVTSLAKELAHTIGMTMSDTVEIAKTFSAIGLEGKDLLAATEATARLSKLGDVSAQQASTAMVSVQNIFKLQASQVTQAVDFLNAAKHSTSTTMQDITDALPRVGPIIQQMGGTYKDFATFLVAMKESGIPAAQGANAIKSMMASLINPTTKAAASFQAMGINLDKIVQGNKGNLVGMINDLNAGLNKLPAEQKLKAIEQLFGKFQFARVSALLSNMGSSTSQAAKVLELYGQTDAQLAAVAKQEIDVATKGTPAARFQKMKASLTADLIPLGQTFLEVFTKIGSVIDKIVKAFNSLGVVGKAILSTLAAAAILGPIIMLVGLFSNLAGQVLKGLNYMRMFKQGMDSALPSQNKFSAGIHGMQNFYRELDKSTIAARNQMDLMPEAITSNAKAFEVLAAAIESLTAQFRALSVAQAESMGMGGIPMAGGSVGPSPFKIPFRAPGHISGIVGLTGGVQGVDSIPAMLAPNESVMTSEATNKYGPILSAMNAGTLEGHIDGNVPGHSNIFGPNAKKYEPKTDLTSSGRSYRGTIGRWNQSLPGGDVPQQMPADNTNYRPVRTPGYINIGGNEVLATERKNASMSIAKLEETLATDSAMTEELTAKLLMYFQSLEADGKAAAYSMSGISQALSKTVGFEKTKLAAMMPDSRMYSASHHGVNKPWETTTRGPGYESASRVQAQSATAVWAQNQGISKASGSDFYNMSRNHNLALPKGVTGYGGSFNSGTWIPGSGATNQFSNELAKGGNLQKEYLISLEKQSATEAEINSIRQKVLMNQELSDKELVIQSAVLKDMQARQVEVSAGMVKYLEGSIVFGDEINAHWQTRIAQAASLEEKEQIELEYARAGTRTQEQMQAALDEYLIAAQDSKNISAELAMTLSSTEGFATFRAQILAQAESYGLIMKESFMEGIRIAAGMRSPATEFIAAGEVVVDSQLSGTYSKLGEERIAGEKIGDAVVEGVVSTTSKARSAGGFSMAKMGLSMGMMMGGSMLGGAVGGTAGSSISTGAMVGSMALMMGTGAPVTIGLTALGAALPLVTNAFKKMAEDIRVQSNELKSALQVSTEATQYFGVKFTPLAQYDYSAVSTNLGKHVKSIQENKAAVDALTAAYLNATDEMTKDYIKGLKKEDAAGLTQEMQKKYNTDVASGLSPQQALQDITSIMNAVGTKSMTQDAIRAKMNQDITPVQGFQSSLQSAAKSDSAKYYAGTGRGGVIVDPNRNIKPGDVNYKQGTKSLEAINTVLTNLGGTSTKTFDTIVKGMDATSKKTINTKQVYDAFAATIAGGDKKVIAFANDFRKSGGTTEQLAQATRLLNAHLFKSNDILEMLKNKKFDKAWIDNLDQLLALDKAAGIVDNTTNGTNGSNGTTPDYTKEFAPLLKKYEGLIKLVTSQTNAQKKYNDQLKLTQDYHQKQMDYFNQMKMATTSGNYLGALAAQQGAKANQGDFRAQMQESKSSETLQGLQDLLARIQEGQSSGKSLSSFLKDNKVFKTSIDNIDFQKQLLGGVDKKTFTGNTSAIIAKANASVAQGQQAANQGAFQTLVVNVSADNSVVPETFASTVASKVLAAQKTAQAKTTASNAVGTRGARP